MKGQRDVFGEDCDVVRVVLLVTESIVTRKLRTRHTKHDPSLTFVVVSALNEAVRSMDDPV